MQRLQSKYLALVHVSPYTVHYSRYRYELPRNLVEGETDPVVKEAAKRSLHSLQGYHLTQNLFWLSEDQKPVESKSNNDTLDCTTELDSQLVETTPEFRKIIEKQEMWKTRTNIIINGVSLDMAGEWIVRIGDCTSGTYQRMFAEIVYLPLAIPHVGKQLIEDFAKAVVLPPNIRARSSFASDESTEQTQNDIARQYISLLQTRDK